MTPLLTTTSTGMLLLLLPFLAIAVATDLQRRKIPNVLVAFMLVSGLVLHTALLGLPGLTASAAGIALGFLVLIPMYALGGMGAGDVKLLAAAGSFLGPWGVLLAGVFTLLVGGVLGLAAIVWRRVVIPLVNTHAFLPRALTRIGTSGTLPYSLAIAAGTIASIVYVTSAAGAAPGTLMAEVTTW